MAWMRVLAIILTGLVTAGAAEARIQAQMFCWITDVEFPVGCDEDEDGGDEDDEEEAEYDSGQSNDA